AAWKVDSGQLARVTTAPAAAQCADADGKDRERQSPLDARGDGAASEEPGVRGLSRTDGPVGVCARELQCDRRTSNDHSERRGAQCGGRHAGWDEVRGPGGVATNSR